MRISANLVPGPDVVGQARLAEQLGYHRVYLTDAPALYFDVWASLALIARETSTIGLGTGVLVPFTRHPVVNAAAIAGIESIAPGRLVVAMGAGNSARRTLGERLPSKLKWMGEYLTTVRALLNGETTEWEGRRIRLMGIEGYWPDFPIEVPLLLNVLGPKGHAVAKACAADGVIGNVNPEFPVNVKLTFGTVLDPDEELHHDRARLAHSPMALAAVHNIYEDRPEVLEAIPGGSRWRRKIDQLAAEDAAHLVVHRGHCVHVTEQDDELTRDRGFLEASRSFGSFTGTAAEVRRTVQGYFDEGASEVMYLPSGPDIERELRAFAAALR